MKLRNKKTGEIGYFCFANWNDPILIIMDENGVQLAKYSSLAELCKEWEDYEEPEKYYWFINPEGEVVSISEEVDGPEGVKSNKQIGNYFETKEEAEKAVERLRAWKRLKDKGFRFDCWYGGSKDMSFSIPQEIIDRATAKDLDLLFGGEE
jgi:hypothetical protein